MSTAQENRAICKRAKFLRELLKSFDATLVGFDPGVTAALPGNPRGRGCWGESMSFEALEWGWLEPLLVELRDRRKAGGKGLTKDIKGE